MNKTKVNLKFMPLTFLVQIFLFSKIKYCVVPGHCHQQQQLVRICITIYAIYSSLHSSLVKNACQQALHCVTVTLCWLENLILAQAQEKRQSEILIIYNLITVTQRVYLLKIYTSQQQSFNNYYTQINFANNQFK